MCNYARYRISWLEQGKPLEISGEVRKDLGTTRVENDQTIIGQSIDYGDTFNSRSH